MITVSFHNQNEIPDKLLKFAVISARYDSRWIYCRHKERDTWEIPGGHREAGEDILETAKRELNEETGAIEFDLKPVSVYGVKKEGQSTYGMLFFAKVKKLGSLSPEMEISEIMFSDKLPNELTYPAIQPLLYERVQGWLNMQSSEVELWDVYDENRNLAGRTHSRGTIQRD